MPKSEIVLELKDINKSYNTAGVKLDVLQGAELSVKQAEKVAIIGESGSGKSTFLHIASLLDKFEKGKILFQNKRIDSLSDKEKSKIRNKNFGFVYQAHLLLKEFTVLENVLIPVLIERRITQKDKNNAMDLLEQLKISDCANKYPSELSGGQQQRVAIARGLIQKPKIVFADEPTGNLDPETAKSVKELFNNIIKKDNISLVIVSHDESLADMCDKVFKLEDKKLVKIKG